jgi:hypothetical protein
MNDWEMRQQVRKFVRDAGVRCFPALAWDKSGQHMEDISDLLCVVEIKPPVVESGKRIRFAIVIEDTLYGVAESRKDAESYAAGVSCQWLLSGKAGK